MHTKIACIFKESADFIGVYLLQEADKIKTVNGDAEKQTISYSKLITFSADFETNYDIKTVFLLYHG